MPWPNRVTLDDKYLLDSGRIYLTGIQALVRLPMMQRQRDLAAGLNTAGFISGYRGSPLGGFDQTLWQAKRFIKSNHIEFQPGVNEDLAATAVWGTQQIDLYPGAKYDGVFAMWYGKGPGVDRCGDVFKHANHAGTSKHGGVLVWPATTTGPTRRPLPHQSDPPSSAAGIPVIHAASVQEYLDFGLHGWAMSRYSGLWVGFKVLGETVDSSASVDVDPAPHRDPASRPTSSCRPTACHIRWPDDWLGQESARHHREAAGGAGLLARQQARPPDAGPPDARFGIVTVGKSYLDVRQALDELGIDEAEPNGSASRSTRSAWSGRSRPQGAKAFAEGKREILVVEEKRPIIEHQLKEALFNAPADRRPVVVGKVDESGEQLLRSDGELTPYEIVSALVARLGLESFGERTRQRFDALKRRAGRQLRNDAGHGARPLFLLRLPAQQLDQGARRLMAMAGIGCHIMAIGMERNTKTFTHMGGEGATWVGAQPLHRHAARLPEPGRRHLFPFRLPGDRATPSRPTSPSPTRSSTTTPSP